MLAAFNMLVALLLGTAIPTPTPWVAGGSVAPDQQNPIQPFLRDGDCLWAWFFEHGPAWDGGPDAGHAHDDAMGNACTRHLSEASKDRAGVLDSSAPTESPDTGFPAEGVARTTVVAVPLLVSFAMDYPENLAGNDFTLSCLVHISALATLAQNTILAGSNIYLGHDGAGKLVGTIGAGVETGVAGSAPLDDWSYLAMRWSAATDEVEIFRDGQDACDGACTTETTGAPPSTAGLIGPLLATLGNVQECSLFKRALSDEEMVRLCRCGLLGHGESTGVGARLATCGGSPAADMTVNRCME